MRIDIISCCPHLLNSPFQHSIIKRAIDKALVQIHIHDLKDHGVGKHQQIDDYPYGGGGGMVLMVAPIVNCLEKLQQARHYDEIIYLAPDGELLSQATANTLSLKRNLIIIAGHYKGIDERIRQHFITKEISIGNYVLSGGELAAAVIVDSIVRLIPNVLSNEMSALSDSFQDDLVAPPTYTRPAAFRGMKVPDILLSGHAANIDEWRHQQSLLRTKQRRPELLPETTDAHQSHTTKAH